MSLWEGRREAGCVRVEWVWEGGCWGSLSRGDEDGGDGDDKGGGKKKNCSRRPMGTFENV